MARTRLIYPSQLLLVGPTGNNSCTGKLSQGSVYNNTVSWASGANLIAELYRVQSISHDWSKETQDVFQFGELGRIDSILINPPTVNLSFNYLQSNLINEKLIGMTINQAGDSQQVSCISGILNGQTDSKNYFIKIVAEGSDAIDNPDTSYSVVSLGNGYLSSYTAQGSVGQIPTCDIAVACLNIQAQSISNTGSVVTPAIFPTDGTSVVGYGYVLPTGLTSYNNVGLTHNQGISALRPGDIFLNLGLGAGDGFAAESDIKIQSYNISFNLSQEDLQKLGSKYAFAKVPTLPISVNMSVSALVGDIQTGSLIEIVNSNKDFQPSVTIKKPGDATTTIAYYQLKGAKLNSSSSSSQIGSNSTIDFSFTATLSSAQDNSNGLFISGVSV